MKLPFAMGLSHYDAPPPAQRSLTRRPRRGPADWRQPVPRHWVYDDSGAPVAKSGLTNFGEWSKERFGDNSPWGDVDSSAVVTAAESALERALSGAIMRGGAKPKSRTLAEGEELVRQGERGRELFLLLDGVLEVAVDGETVAELGPGAVGGERALLEGGKRTSTLRARTRARVAIAIDDEVDTAALQKLAQSHRREEQSTPQTRA